MRGFVGRRPQEGQLSRRGGRTAEFSRALSRVQTGLGEVPAGCDPPDQLGYWVARVTVESLRDVIEQAYPDQPDAREVAFGRIATLRANKIHGVTALEE